MNNNILKEMIKFKIKIKKLLNKIFSERFVFLNNLSSLGFTLVETLVVIFIFSLIMGLLAAVIVTLYRTQDYTREQSLAIEEARRGIEIMVKEIRGVSVGDDGSYPIEKADDKEFIFYSDIDGDGNVERVRYFLGTVNSGIQNKECETSLKGGTCSVNFANFLRGALTSAQVRVFLDGDLGASNEHADLFADGSNLDRFCQTGCTDCLGAWQDARVFDVTSRAADNSISFLVDASDQVDPTCPYAMKARFEFSWTEELSGFDHEFRKGVTKPVRNAGGQISYPSDQEKIQVITSFVRNAPPIFTYFDKNGSQLASPFRLIDTKIMKVYLIINVNPNRPPQDFDLESYVQLRNLKEE